MAGEFFNPRLDEVKFVLEDFEGPLDLLLSMIKENNLDIMTVKLSELTDQYMKYMENVGELELDKATEFLVMAATMLQIKSNNLLPVEVEEAFYYEEDPETDLKLKLLELDLLREKSDEIKKLETLNRFYVEPKFTEEDAVISIRSFNMEKMLEAYAKLLIKTSEAEGRTSEKKIEKERFTVREKFLMLADVLKERKRVRFSELFEGDCDKGEIIITFLALLELLKRQFACAVQNDGFGDIDIEYREGGTDLLDLAGLEEEGN